jgi:small-conductance mechanosensitive channel
VHIIPFSAVTSVTNTSRGIGNASVAVNIAYKEDVDRSSQVLKDIAAEATLIGAACRNPSNNAHVDDR